MLILHRILPQHTTSGYYSIREKLYIYIFFSTFRRQHWNIWMLVLIKLQEWKDSRFLFFFLIFVFVLLFFFYQLPEFYIRYRSPIRGI